MNKSLRIILDVITITINPSWWLMNSRYDKMWDCELNQLMKTHKFIPLRVYYTILGAHHIWIGNYPYAAFVHPQISGRRPSRLTIMKARRKLKYDLLSVSEKRDVLLRELV